MSSDEIVLCVFDSVNYHGRGVPSYLCDSETSDSDLYLTVQILKMSACRRNRLKPKVSHFKSPAATDPFIFLS